MIKAWVLITILCISIFFSACERELAVCNRVYTDSMDTLSISETFSKASINDKIQLYNILQTNSIKATDGTAIPLDTDIAITQKAVGKPVACEPGEITVYILGDYQIDSNLCHNSYLAIALDGYTLLHDLQAKSLKDTLYLADIDADGLDEIIIHQHLDDFGGAGTYLSRVYRIENETIHEMFHSYTSSPTDDVNGIFDTGYTSDFLEGKRIKITNKRTNYQTILDISEKYTDDFFDSNGKGPAHLHINTDSFFMFMPEDVDVDGVVEIVAYQYIFLFNHADGIGYGKSILKYNTQTQQFDVIDAEFHTEY